MRVLLTGGTGFIGSHTALALAEAGHEPVLFDNFANSERSIPDRLARIAGRQFDMIEGDVRDEAALASALEGADAVVHFAALKSVAESVRSPLHYHDNNVGGLLSLLRAMDGAEVRRMVFSSSATVYGDTQSPPIEEDCPLRAINPYGNTKLMGETLLGDLVAAPGSDWEIAILRYFNPVGAHPSGLVGEAPTARPSNLMPLLVRAAMGRGHLDVFGTDYPTRDGSAVRDYLHVMDLAEGHVAALDALGANHAFTVNLGTGAGTSVFEMIAAFEEATGAAVPFRTAPRREGDAAQVYASAAKARDLLGWETRRSLADMCVDAWRFARMA